jgi:hypothetical protein
MAGLRPVVDDEQLAVLRILVDRRRSLGEDHTRMVSQLLSEPDDVEAPAAMGPKYGIRSDPQATAKVVAEHGLVERLA